MDPFHGYRCTIDDQVDDTISMLDASHVVKLGTAALDEEGCRVRHDIHDHRGPRDDPLHRIRNLVHAGKDHLTGRHKTRLETALTVEKRHAEVEVAWHCAHQLRSVDHQSSHANRCKVAKKILASFLSRPMPKITRLERTPNR